MWSNLPLNLAQKLLLIIFLAVLPPLFVLGSYLLSAQEERELKHISDIDRNNLNFVKYQLNRELVYFKNTAKVIAADEQLHQALAAKQRQGLSSQLNSIAKIHPEINYLILLDSQESVFAVNTINRHNQMLYSEHLLGSHLKDHPLLPELGNMPTYSAPGKDPFLQRFDVADKYVQWFAAPVMIDAKPAGWLILCYDWQTTMTALNAALVQDLNRSGMVSFGGGITDQNNELLAGFLSPESNVYEESIPIEIANKTFNLVLQSDKNIAFKAVNELRNSILASALVTFVALLALFYFFAYRQFLQPINQLALGANKFREGDFDFRLPLKGKDEFAKLAKQFNNMGNTLQDARSNLESKVQERTEALLHANKQLEQAIDEVKEANLIKSEFLASMSHEIRTPMNGVLGMLTLLEDTDQDEKQQHYTRLAITSANSLLTVINDILDFSKVEAGMLDLEMLDFDLETFFGDFAETIEVQRGERPIDIILNMDESSCHTVGGDPARLRQILYNLVGNALKFTERGEIEITVSTIKYDNLEQLRCEIRDTGIGIPQEAIPGLFNAFTQLDSSNTRRYGGTGLGLAIVSQLCELMGGWIGAESELGKGSTFSFEVFLDARHASTIPIELPPLDKVLILEKNSTYGNLIKSLLENWQCEAIYANDFDIGLAQLQQHPVGSFDLVIVDNDLLEELDKDSKPQLLALIDACKTKKLLSVSVNTLIERAQLKAEGFDALVHKPTRVSNLRTAIKQAFAEPEKPRRINGEQPVDNIPSMDLKGKILLVEDNMINQLVAKEVMEGYGLEVTIAANGQLALDELQASGNPCPYDLIVMDCQMPVLDGYQATEKIRSGEAGSHNAKLPIIAMTANAMAGDEKKCLQAGMSAYASKPLDPVAFKSMLKQYIPELIH